MRKVSMATVWLDGCSGCHMSFLDIDEALLQLAPRIDLVYSPLVDAKTFPEMADVTLIEGAVSSEHDLEKIKHVRAHTRVLVSLGDCAVTGNVPSMRNPFSVQDVVQRAYFENVSNNPQQPQEAVPGLLSRVRPVHHIVPVDVFIPGCPPSAQAILQALTDLLDGKLPELNARFG